MDIEILKHVPFEGPGLISDWAGAHSHELHTVEVYRDEPLLRLDNIDLLIIMGGPMSVTEEDVHPWLPVEKAHIRAALEKEIPALGVCLGAQLLAEALGASVTCLSEKEIGWHPVTKVAVEKSSFVHHLFPSSMDVFHWHGETFNIPEGAQPLARSAACENQAFLYSNRVLALQFHLEMQPIHVKTLIKNCADDLANPGPWVQPKDDMMQTTPPPQNQEVLFGMLDHLAAMSSR